MTEAARLRRVRLSTATGLGHSPHRLTLRGIGIGSPGVVDAKDGTIQAAKRSWRGLPLGRQVTQRFGIPAHVANDSQAAALAECVFASTRAATLIVIQVGEGIGAGIVLSSSLQGDGFGAGEIGHSVVDPGARPAAVSGVRAPPTDGCAA